MDATLAQFLDAARRIARSSGLDRFEMGAVYVPGSAGGPGQLIRVRISLVAGSRPALDPIERSVVGAVRGSGSIRELPDLLSQLGG